MEIALPKKTKQGQVCDLPLLSRLVVARESLPDCLEVTAWTEQEGQIHEIMGFKHKHLNVEGVQFHPESIVSEHGHALFRNFVEKTDQGELV